VKGIRANRANTVWAPAIVLLTVWLAYPSGQVPVVAIDEGHFNVHTESTTYRGLADALRRDGFRVDALASRFTRDLLAPIAVLVISNARAAASGPLEERGRPAFTSSELDILVDWVHRGGGLLLVVDHYPIGGANHELGARFGVDIRNGYTSDPLHQRQELSGQVALSARGTVTTSDQIIFERAVNALGDHPITCGRIQAERVDRVATFGGTSFDAPPAAVPLLRFSDSATDAIGPARTRRSAAGRNQGLALPFGEGRVVFLGEAAMLTNIDQPAVQNRQFAINVVRWLAGGLNDTGTNACDAR
jgi:hypothetical protein